MSAEAVEWLEREYDRDMRLVLGLPSDGVRSIWVAASPGGIPRPIYSLKGDDSEPGMTCFGSEGDPGRSHP